MMATKTDIVRGKVKATPAQQKLTSKQWADKVNAAWRKTAEGFIETGQILNVAKAALKYGEWGKCLQDLDFDEDKAQKLMKIAKTTPLSNTANLRYLPPSFTTLHTLTQLEDKHLATAIKKGDVHPNMGGRDAEELVEKYQPEPEPEPKEEEAADKPAPKGKGNVSREADDADHEPTPKGSTPNSRPARKTEPSKPEINQAFDNLDAAAETLDEFCDKADLYLDSNQGDGFEPDAALIEKLEGLAEKLLDLIKRLGEGE
jgi:hypothetical protein